MKDIALYRAGRQQRFVSTPLDLARGLGEIMANHFRYEVWMEAVNHDMIDEMTELAMARHGNAYAKKSDIVINRGILRFFDLCGLNLNKDERSGQLKLKKIFDFRLATEKGVPPTLAVDPELCKPFKAPRSRVLP